MDINSFLGGEVKRFMNTERLDESSQAVVDEPTFINQDKQDVTKGASSPTSSFLMGGGGGTASFSFGSMSSSVGNFSLSFSEQEEQQEKREKEKTTKKNEKIRVKKGTQDEGVGHTASNSTPSLFDVGIPESGEQSYKNNPEGYIPVQSSNLKAVKYDAETKQLNVQFLSGTEYSYDEVPVSKYNNLMGESSHGSYFYWNIRGKGVPKPSNAPYSYHKI